MLWHADAALAKIKINQSPLIMASIIKDVVFSLAEISEELSKPMDVSGDSLRRTLAELTGFL